jgi:hypothetical protein
MGESVTAGRFGWAINTPKKPCIEQMTNILAADFIYQS